MTNKKMILIIFIVVDNNSLMIINKYLTKFGAMVLYLNWNKMAYLKNCTNFYMTSQ